MSPQYLISTVTLIKVQNIVRFKEYLLGPDAHGSIRLANIDKRSNNNFWNESFLKSSKVKSDLAGSHYDTFNIKPRPEKKVIRMAYLIQCLSLIAAINSFQEVKEKAHSIGQKGLLTCWYSVCTSTTPST